MKDKEITDRDPKFWSDIEFVVKNKNLIDALEIAESLPTVSIDKAVKPQEKDEQEG